MRTSTTAIGYADSAEGLVALSANTIELKYTLYGDTGLTGTVGFTDFMRMTQHYTQNSGATWSDGDFNYDGSVNVADFNLLQPDYGQSLPAPILTPIVVAPPSPARPPRVVTAPPPAAVLMPSLDGNAAVMLNAARGDRYHQSEESLWQENRSYCAALSAGCHDRSSFVDA